MKRTILLSIIFFGVLCSNSIAQDDKTPTGSFALDLNFNPAAIFDASASTMFNMPGIKARFFLNNNLALRLNLDFGYGSNKSYDDLDGDDFTKTKNTRFGISPGFEKLYGLKRFYIYLGAEIPITSYSTKTIIENNGTTTEIKNLDNGYFRIGLHGILGVDFYIFPKLYVGAEFTPGYIYTNYYDTKVDNDVTDKGGSGSSFSLSASSGVRIGIRF